MPDEDEYSLVSVVPKSFYSHLQYPLSVSWGILDQFGLAATLVFVAPLALAGLELLVKGNLTIGTSLLVVALAMVLVERYITTPSDLPGLVASKLVGTVAQSPDEREPDPPDR